MKHGRIVALSAVVFMAAAAGQEIQVRQLALDRYELTLVASEPLAESAAQALLSPRAAQACRGADPRFGNYYFESQVPVERDGTRSDQKASFKFVQEISCGRTTNSSRPLDTELGVRRTDLVKTVESFVTESSIRYLKARSQGNYEEAYAALSEYLRVHPLSEWSQSVAEFNQAAGGLQSAVVWRVTVYDNPPGAPRPGRYIAADFESVYERTPLQCGYLVWFELPDDRFAITRQEISSIPPEFFEPSRAAELSRLKQEFGCAPRATP